MSIIDLWKFHLEDMLYIFNGGFALIMLLHFIGDFVCQGRYLAENKSKGLATLCAHVSIYTCILGVGLFIIRQFSYAEELDSRMLLAFCIANWILHFITDAITSRLTAKLWQSDNKYWFFTTVGFDQFIHFLCLYYTAIFYFDFRMR
jgi:ABC-type Co2+ transport system permease subunit